MKMYANHNVSYASNEDGNGGSFSSCPSTASSFSSDSSSCSWESEMVMMTPTSTPRRGTPSLVKVEGSPSQNPTPTSSPNRYEPQASFCSMTTMSQNILSGYNDPSFLYHSDATMLSDQPMIDYSNYNSFNNMVTSLRNPRDHHLESLTRGDNLMCDTFQANQAMSMEPPGLTLDLFSPESGMSSSPRSEDFVIPSETTFINAFDMHSPMAPVKSLQFDISYDSPLSEFNPNFAMDEVSNTASMSYFMPSQTSHQDPASSSPAPTPSRSSLRQSMYRAPPSTAALQRVQAIKSEDLDRTRYQNTRQEDVYRNLRRDDNDSAARLKRIKRESKDFILGGIRIQRPARKECPFVGCTGKFQRQEHLKRHEKTHMKNAEVYQCEFCLKTFGRSDNLKSHVRLHTLPDGSKKSRRTAYHPAAMEAWKRMDRKRGKSGVLHDGDENLRVKHEEEKALRARVTGY